MEHCIGRSLLSQRVKVHLVGVGGNGAQMANCLARLDIAIRALGHPYGLHVTAFDGDRVSESNVGRQIYSPADVGLHKAVVTIHRLNQYFGLDWDAVPRHYEASLATDHGGGPSIVISCVDSARSRRDLHRNLFQRGSRATYWLDLGNSADSGQFVLGQPLNGRNRRSMDRLRTAPEVFPELSDESLDATDGPSCSAAEALERQEPFVNQTLAQHALALLTRLFRYGRIDHHGAFVNVAQNRVQPLAISPTLWSNMRRRGRRFLKNVAA